MQVISVQEYKARLDAGESMHLLDVREPMEFAEVNMGGKLLPLGQISMMQTESIDAWKDEEIIVQCRSGARSAQACMLLENIGFKNVKNLSGGILAWLDLQKNL